MVLGAAGVRSLVLSVAITSQLAGANIPEFYQSHQFFPQGDQVCTRENAGPRADIYCRGRILEAVMAMRLFNDSKTFVDKPLLYDPEEIIERFERTFPTDDDITRDAMTEFVNTNFGLEGEEMEDCELSDWTEKPAELAKIQDPKLREFAYSINGIWRRLCRQFKQNVAEHEDRFSLIYVPNKFIVPGGRFREYYYWDSYWIIKGLLASGMYDTTRNILLNLAYIVEKVGFIPNGGRIYYLARSQPPMLIPMFYEYLEATGDIEFVKNHLPTLEKEFEFWNKRRNVSVQIGEDNYMMYQYRAESNVPRPESYREDVELVKDKPWEEKATTWKNLASAAEAGYDFSSRWFQNYTELSTIDTTNVVEVDLNSFMCWNMEILSHFYSQIPGGEEKEQVYRERHVNFKRDFQKVFWVNDKDGWYDYNLRAKKNNIEFYPSNLAPFFTRCYDSLDHLKSERVYKKIVEFGAMSHDGGIPTSLHQNTGQQWDSPNAWPPLEHMMIDGLRRSESPKLQEYAFEMAKVWVRVNYNTFNRTGVFWEKYAVDGSVGSGGEYVVQAGFGWTNGVMLDVLVSYAERLEFNAVEATKHTTPASTDSLTRAKRFARMPSSHPSTMSRARRLMRVNN